MKNKIASTLIVLFALTGPFLLLDLLMGCQAAAPRVAGVDAGEVRQIAAGVVAEARAELKAELHAELTANLNAEIGTYKRDDHSSSVNDTWALRLERINEILDTLTSWWMWIVLGLLIGVPITCYIGPKALWHTVGYLWNSVRNRRGVPP